MDSTFKKITYTLAGVLVFIFLLINVCWGYWYFFGVKKQTIGVTYAQTVEDSEGNKFPIFKANLFDNSNKSGQKMIELQITYYSDFEKTAIEQRTFQWFFDMAYKEEFYAGDSYYYPVNVYEYKGDTKTHWKTESPLAFGDPLFIEIDGEMYSFSLTGTYDRTTYTPNVFVAIWNAIAFTFTGNKEYTRRPGAVAHVEKGIQYTMADVMQTVANSIVKSSEGYGDYSTSLYDFSQYFSIQKFNKKSGKMEDFQADYDFLRNYFYIEVHADKWGVTKASQSLVNMIKYDANYDGSGLKSVEYSADKTVLNLTAADFEKHKSEFYGGYLLSLNSDFLAMLRTNKELVINVDLDLDNVDNPDGNVVGFDLYALYGLSLNSVKIKSTKTRDFIALDYSLGGSGLSNVICTPCITFKPEANAFKTLNGGN